MSDDKHTYKDTLNIFEDFRMYLERGPICKIDITAH